jgi:hypothetical protein
MTSLLGFDNRFIKIHIHDLRNRKLWARQVTTKPTVARQ